MAKYVKAIRQTLNEIRYASPLDEYSFVMTWKARLDFRILTLIKVPLKTLVAQGASPITYSHSGSGQPSQGALHTHMTIPALTSHLLPYPL